MNDRLTMKETFQFAAPGTLKRPRWIGRLVRGGLGVLLALIVWELGFHSDVGDLRNPGYWVAVVLGLLLAPYVVNIGFGVQWGAWPRIVAMLLIVATAAYGYLIEGVLLGQPLWSVSWGFSIYVLGHLGISFLLSAALATPGCEMRAVPQLLALARRQSAREHYCPGFIDKVDRWERERKLPPEQRSDLEARDKDLVRSVGRMLLFYGLPFGAIQITAFVGGRTVAAVVWTLGFAAMGAVVVANAVRSRRVHGYFTGPWFLLTAIATVMMFSGDLQITGPVLLNTGLGVGLLLYLISERLWGRYFGIEQKHKTQ